LKSCFRSLPNYGVELSVDLDSDDEDAQADDDEASASNSEAPAANEEIQV